MSISSGKFSLHCLKGKKERKGCSILISIREMQIKSTPQSHFASDRRDIPKISTNNPCKNCRNIDRIYKLVEI